MNSFSHCRFKLFVSYNKQNGTIAKAGENHSFLKKSNTYKWYPFTLLELLIVISVIMIMMSMLLVAIKKTKEVAQQIQCNNNLKQMCLVVMLYADDNNEYLPRPAPDWATPDPCPTYPYWYNVLAPSYIQNILRCPSYSGNNRYFAYGYRTTPPFQRTGTSGAPWSSSYGFQNVRISVAARYNNGSPSTFWLLLDTVSFYYETQYSLFPYYDHV